MSSQVRPGVSLALLLVAATAWCVFLPPFWALNLGEYVSMTYLERLGLYIPELVVAAVVVVSLVLLALRHSLSVFGFAAAAIIAPVLHFAIGSPSVGVWPVSFALLALVTWRLLAFFKRGA